MSANLFADVLGRKRIELPEVRPDFWIEVRQELSVGEQRAMFARAYKGQVQTADGETRNEYDVREISLGQVIAYLVDWNDKAEVTPDAVRELKPAVYAQIEDAIAKHVEALRGNDQTAGTKRPKRNVAPISPSAA